MTRQRYWIVLLLFAVTFINYMDRVNFSVSIPAIQKDLGFDLRQIGQITFAWSLIYALFNFPGGWIADRLGLRWGMVLALGWWSVFTIATPYAAGLNGWFVLRGLMGAGEAPIWSFIAKASHDWMADDERATAYGFAGAGEFLGPAVGALATGWIAKTIGWQYSFVLFGLAGLLILPAWIKMVRDTPADHPAVNAQEKARIGVVTDHKSVDWAGLRCVIFSRVGCGILLTYITSGYVLFTFKNWIPAYMHDQFHSDIVGGAAWSSLSAVFGFVGFLLAGPINDALVRRMDRLTARRLGTAVPTVIAISCLIGSWLTARAGMEASTAVLLGVAQFLSTITVGAWAINVIDLSPNRASTGVLYGFYNGMLNLAGAANSLVIVWLATAFGFPTAFASTVLFMILFIAGMVWVMDRPGYERLLAAAK